MAANEKTESSNEQQKGEPRDRRREVPLDTASRRERQPLDELEGRRQQLNEEEEMNRRNQRSQMLRMKNRMRASRR